MNTPNEFPASDFELYDINALVLEAQITYKGYEDIKQNIGSQADPASEGAKILSDAEHLIGCYRNTYDQFRDAAETHAQLSVTEDETFAEATALKETLEQEKQRPKPLSKPAAPKPYVPFLTPDGVESSSASQRVLLDDELHVGNQIDETNAIISELEAQISTIETEELPQLWQKLDEKQALICSLLSDMTLLSNEILELALKLDVLPATAEESQPEHKGGVEPTNPELMSRKKNILAGQKVAIRRGFLSNTVVSFKPIEVDKDAKE